MLQKAEDCAKKSKLALKKQNYLHSELKLDHFYSD